MIKEFKLKKIFFLLIITNISFSQNNTDIGLDFFQKGNYKKAIELFSIDINNNQNLIKSYHNRGRAYYRLNDFYNASRDSDNACKLGDCILKEYIKSNNVYMVEQEKTPEINHKVEQEKTPEINHKVETKLTKTEQIFDSINYLENIAKSLSYIIKPKNISDEQSSIINAFEHKIEYYNQLIRKDKDINAYYIKGLVSYCNKNYHDAISCFNSVIFDDEKYNNEIYLYRGISYYHIQDYYNSTEDFSELIERNYIFNDIYFYRAICNYKKEDYDESIKDLDFIINKEPDFSESYYYKGLCLKEKEDYQESENNLLKAISLNQKKDLYHYYLGLLYHEQKKYKEAIEKYTKAISINPKESIFYNNRGTCYVIIGKIKEAKKDAEKECSLGNCNLKKVIENNIK